MNLYDAAQARTALDDAISSGEPGTIAAAIVANAWPLYSSHHALLASALRTLPGPVLDTHPLLRLLHPLTPVLARTMRPSRTVLDDAERLGGDELDLILVAEMIAFRAGGDIEGALRCVQRLDERLRRPRAGDREHPDGPLWFFHLQIGSTWLAAGDSSRALVAFAAARQRAALAAQPDASRMVLGRIALAHAIRGSVGDASHALDDATSRLVVTAAHAASIRSTESATAALIGVEALVDSLDELTAALEPYDSVELGWPFALLARCRALLAQHRADDALEAVRLAAGTHPRQAASFASDVVTAATLDALTTLGDHDRAGAIVRMTQRPGPLTTLATIRLRLRTGELDGASRLLDMLSAEQALPPATQTERALLAAWLELARSGAVDRDTAESILRIGMRPGARRVLASVPLELLNHVRRHFPTRTGGTFDEVVDGLDHIEFRPRPRLTAAELRVLGALATARTTAEIASTFQVSVNTVKSQLAAVYRKLGCTTRADAVRLASGFHLLAQSE